MDALILLLISICLLTVYGLIYITLRMRKGIDDAEKTLLKKTFLVMLSITCISGVAVITLFYLTV